MRLRDVISSDDRRARSHWGCTSVPSKDIRHVAGLRDENLSTQKAELSREFSSAWVEVNDMPWSKPRASYSFTLSWARCRNNSMVMMIGACSVVLLSLGNDRVPPWTIGPLFAQKRKNDTNSLELTTQLRFLDEPFTEGPRRKSWLLAPHVAVSWYLLLLIELVAAVVVVVLRDRVRVVFILSLEWRDVMNIRMSWNIVKWGYQRSPEVTWGYQRSPEATRGYLRLPEVTRHCEIVPWVKSEPKWGPRFVPSF